jgi:thiamine biosynthesis lipoprotein
VTGTVDPAAVSLSPALATVPPAELTATFTAMATKVTLRVVDPGPGAHQAMAAAEEVFRRVESACTRFDPTSALMRANAQGGTWCAVPRECFLALAEAARAHEQTGGLFDPRVLRTLVTLGYDRSLPFADGPVRTGGDPPAGLPPQALRRPWRPAFDDTRQAVMVGPESVDLGGIGKGLAVRWAAQALAEAGTGHLVEAGGDCHVAGRSPDGDGWRIGVEDPAGESWPLAVLQLRDMACATSSVRLRTWQASGRTVHHLIDPRTGTSAAGGLRSVTVVGDDPARAEVWSKSLLIAGRDTVAGLAGDHGLAALWVDDDNRTGHTPLMAEYVIWERPYAR